MLLCWLSKSGKARASWWVFGSCSDRGEKEAEKQQKQRLLAVRVGGKMRILGAFLLVVCVGHVEGFAPMGGSTLPGLKHVSTSRLIEAATSVGGMQTSALSLRPRSESCFRQHVRSSMSVQVAAGEDVLLEVLKQSVVVEANLEECYGVASNLDAYTRWCSKGGMKKVIVLERNEDELATKVQLTAGKLGVDMLNVMEYSYNFPHEVAFKSIEGDVMKTLQGRYVFESSEGSPEKTDVTYELSLEFGFPLPNMVRKQICGAIMRTALTAFKHGP